MKKVHVGHDCEIGDDCEIAVRTMIAGHCTIGNGVRIGVGGPFGPYITIGDDVRLGAGRCGREGRARRRGLGRKPRAAAGAEAGRRMTISVIVPIAGDLDRAWQCFISLAALDESPAHEIIVVDDSAPGLEHLLERLAGDVRSVRTGSRGGFAAAANAGSRAAEGDMLVFLRDAGRVAPQWLVALAAELDRPGTVAATSATLGPTSTHPSESLAVALRRSDAEG